MDPMSMPLPTTAQGRPALVKFVQPGASTVRMRGAIPCAPITAAVTVPERCEAMALRNCEVSTNEVDVVVWLLFSASTAKKKKSLSFLIGPPMLPPKLRNESCTRSGQRVPLMVNSLGPPGLQVNVEIVSPPTLVNPL